MRAQLRLAIATLAVSLSVVLSSDDEALQDFIDTQTDAGLHYSPLIEHTVTRTLTKGKLTKSESEELLRKAPARHCHPCDVIRLLSS